MEMLGKIVRGLASIPIIGGALVFVLGFLPLLLVIPLNLSNGISMIIGGLLMATWCYFLSAKKIINIVTPLLPLPLWIFGVIMALAGVYGIVTGKWDESKVEPETVMQSEPVESTPDQPVPAKPEVSTVDTPKVEQLEKQQDPAAVEKALEARQTELKTYQDEAAETALVQLQESLESMKQLEKTVGKEKLQEIMQAHGDGENSINFEDAMAEMQRQIDDLKRKGYGAESNK